MHYTRRSWKSNTYTWDLKALAVVNRRYSQSPAPMLLPLATVAAYSCFMASQPSNQEGGRLPGAQRAQRGVVAYDERREGLLSSNMREESGHHSEDVLGAQSWP